MFTSESSIGFDGFVIFEEGGVNVYDCDLEQHLSEQKSDHSCLLVRFSVCMYTGVLSLVRERPGVCLCSHHLHSRSYVEPFTPAANIPCNKLKILLFRIEHLES